MKLPIEKAIIDRVLDNMNIKDISQATIRQACDMSFALEREASMEFLHLEIGVPGLPAEQIGIQAECEALSRGVASVYPNMFGAHELKEQSARFVKAFLDLDVSPAGCVPTVGSMQGSFAAFMLCAALDPKKDTILFIDPGFPVQRSQTNMLGIKSVGFDIYDYRAEKLHEKLESYLSQGNIAGIVYSNPNNPAWFCLTEGELKTIGELATKYDTIVIEDLAYFCMDFRHPLGNPFKAPFQPSVSKYTQNYMLLISGSKIFSYAGQRVAIAVISDALFGRSYPELGKKFNMSRLGDAYALTILYGASAGVSHSVQYGLAAMFKAAADGQLDFVGKAAEYARRAKIAKEIFMRHGFHLIYDKDIDEELSDGFFFTVGYGDMVGSELMKEMLFYGISSIPLNTTGSMQNGLRICVSQMNKEHQFELLEERLKIFAQNHKK